VLSCECWLVLITIPHKQLIQHLTFAALVMASILMGVIPIIFAFAQELRTTVHGKMVIWLATSSFIS
jgi:hypothetical protein